MKPGDLVTTSYIRASTRYGWEGYKASKGKRMVFIYLGEEPKNGQDPLNPIEVLKALGWTPPEGLEEANEHHLSDQT